MLIGDTQIVTQEAVQEAVHMKIHLHHKLIIILQSLTYRYLFQFGLSYKRHELVKKN